MRRTRRSAANPTAGSSVPRPPPRRRLVGDGGTIGGVVVLLFTTRRGTLSVVVRPLLLGGGGVGYGRCRRLRRKETRPAASQIDRSRALPECGCVCEQGEARGEIARKAWRSKSIDSLVISACANGSARASSAMIARATARHGMMECMENDGWHFASCICLNWDRSSCQR